jgi:hypothetical protein
VPLAGGALVKRLVTVAAFVVALGVLPLVCALEWLEAERRRRA